MTPSAVTPSFAEASGGGAGVAFPLTPMQMGMLYQAVREGRDAGYDVEQIRFSLAEQIDVTAFGAAWNFVARAHSALSSCFAWEALPVPCQRLLHEVVVPLEVVELTAASAERREERLAAFLREDRARGFDLALGPLLRVTVFVDGAHSEVVWTVHHGIVDGRSFVIVLTDVFRAYDALRAGERLESPALVPAYADFVAWLSTRNHDESRVYFRALLGDRRMPTPLPAAEPEARGAPRAEYLTVANTLSRDVMAGLRARASREGVPLGAVVSAAWAIVLHRYTRETDVLFGATRNCRRTALEGRAVDMVGLFINTLPLRVDFSSEGTIAGLLAELAKQSLALRAHEQTPLTEIQSQSRVPRNLPLFESLVTFETKGLDTALRATGAPRFHAVKTALHEKPAFPLNVLVEAGDELEVRLLFDPRRIRRASGERLLASLCFVFAELADAKLERLADVEVVPPDEREKILHAWNATAHPLPPRLLVHAGFEVLAAKRPDDVAVESRAGKVTYGELDRRARALSAELRTRGARPGTFVGVCVGRDADLVVALLAVLMSGAAYVPLDAREPGARLVNMLEDAKASLVVTVARHRELFAGLDVLDVSAPLPSSDHGGDAHAARDTEPCYTIFTSGSTGKPNGAVLTHRAVVNTLDWVNRTFGVGPGDRVLFVNSPAFDLSVYDLFGIFAAGGTVVIADEKHLTDPAELLGLLRDERITIWNSTPGAFQRVLGQLEGSLPDASLRLVLLSGDWIPVKLPDAIRAAFPHARVVSLGGATEAAIWSNWFPIERVEPAWTSIPYGRPIQNARYHALDERMQPVPIGVVGDLYIGGLCVAEGYLNRDELNAKRFVADPFGCTTHPSHLYRTGDLVRYFPDGNLEFLGRADFQVKVRGFRVELGEVEMALLAVLGVKEAVCTTRADASGEKSLVAYVVAHEGVEIDEPRIKSAVSKSLPPFMMPSRVVFLAALPLSKNGKVDRGALPEPRALGQERAFVAARDERERRLVALWEELLEREPIGVTDDFFDVGGHSLLSLTLLGRCRTDLGLTLSLPRFLEQPTIEGIVRSLGESAAPVQVSRHFYTYNGAGRRPPIVLVGAGHFALLYREFPKLFPADQPVHFVQLSTAEASDARTIVDLVETEVLAACPSGPVVVGAFDASARAALTLARRLEARGRDVPLLVLVDPDDGAGTRAPSLPARVLRAGQRLRDLVRDKLDGDGAHGEPLRAAAIVVSSGPAPVGSGVADPAESLRRVVTGSVDVLRVPGDHMSFLAQGQHHAVVDAIRTRIDGIILARESRRAR
ncbi:MAG TPA: amino acid adenylation domain-containing protein [Polyangiaceae bacterium]|jgi:amino acid adenylation domain-containing protein|nr:amino acid adenylation domain-containing protein [Polyangiaceae bacterium]